MLQAMLDTMHEIAQAEQVSDQVTEQVQRLLDALGNSTLSANDLMAKVGLNHRPTFRKNYLAPALEQRLVEMTVPDKPNSSKQRYRKI